MDPSKPSKPSEASHPIPDDPGAPASAEEIAEAVRLRDALDDPVIENEAAALARAMAVGHAPREIDAAEHRAIVERVMVRAAGASAAKKQRDAARASGGRVIRWAFDGAGGLL